MLTIHFMADDRFADLIGALRRASIVLDPVTGEPDDDAFKLALADHDIMRLGMAADVIEDRAADRDLDLRRIA